MIIQKITGGLGNQLNGYVSARSLAIDLNQDLYLDKTFYDTKGKAHTIFLLDNFNIQIKGYTSDYEFKRKFAENRKNNIPIKTIGGNIDPKNLENFRNCDIQINFFLEHPKFFFHNYDLIRKDLEIINKPSTYTKNLLKEISSHDSIAIHIRRGDYFEIHNKYIATILPLKWYKSNINNMAKNLNDPVCFVFSNDIPWVSKNLNLNLPTVYIYNRNRSMEESTIEDLQLMSSCKHQIIAASSFSRWACMLNKYQDKKIIFPDPWWANYPTSYKDILSDINAKLSKRTFDSINNPNILNIHNIHLNPEENIEIKIPKHDSDLLINIVNKDRPAVLHFINEFLGLEEWNLKVLCRINDNNYFIFDEKVKEFKLKNVNNFPLNLESLEIKLLIDK
ncbi:MAG: alpha-1,2-fucosyltransferase [Methanobrevibacter sp.]|jgi:hypothetical protein|nr:alpha-1,2-fucosyltransferase [Candidatus Methanoflexus mossambicus]